MEKYNVHIKNDEQKLYKCMKNEISFEFFLITSFFNRKEVEGDVGAWNLILRFQVSSD